MSTAPDNPDDPTDSGDETIRLGKFLKWANLADSGSEARDLVQGGYVRIDGEVETRRGRQLHRGQEVTLARPGQPAVTVVVEDI